MHIEKYAKVKRDLKELIKSWFIFWFRKQISDLNAQVNDLRGKL